MLFPLAGCATTSSKSSENTLNNPSEARTLQDLIDEGEAGEPGVQFYLGWFYETQRDEPQSNFEAARWYRMAAQQGYVDAMYRLGVLHDLGHGIGQDLEEAARWYRQAAEHGEARAQYNIGMMYDNGEGVARDRSRAREWYLAAAEQGYAPAQNNLGVLYANGEGVQMNSAEAVGWYRKAAEKNYAQAQYNLAMMYYYGRGVPHSFVEAYSWCYLSMANGGNPAALRHIVRHLSPDEVREGLRRAGEIQREIREAGRAAAAPGVEDLAPGESGLD